MPTWIPSIVNSAFGGPKTRLQGRQVGDSLVGSPGRQNRRNYNAAKGLPPCVVFGTYTASTDKEEDPEITNSTCTNRPPRNSEPIPQEASGPAGLSPRKFNGNLFVKGFRVDVIKRRSGRAVHGMIHQEALEMGGWPNVNTKNQVPEKLWRTLVADRGPDGVNAPSWYHRACLECLAHVDANGDLNTNNLKGLKGASTTVVTFLERVQSIIWTRRFFESEGKPERNRKPYFGLASPKARVGDVICIFFGCSVPVLLREFGSGDDQYFEFIGECYVHGMMDGEAVKTKSRPPEYPYDRAETFRLR